MIVIVDYNIGNVGAVANMLISVGGNAVISSDESCIEKADKLILPGTGAFDSCMLALKKTGIVPLIERKVIEEKVPILGICVGAQMMGLASDEGNEVGLGWVDMKSKKFPNHLGVEVPNMGWSDVVVAEGPDEFFIDYEETPRFYFAHSYYLEPEKALNIWMTASHGLTFAAAIHDHNIYGVQFHPEKSHRFGKHFFEKFLLL